MLKSQLKKWTLITICTALGLGLALTSNFSQAAIYDLNGNKLPDAEVNSAKVNWKLLKAQQGKKYNGVGLLNVEYLGFCTAFFLNTGGQKNAPAYALTNGHCSGRDFPGANEIIVNRSPKLVLKLNYFFNEPDRIHPIGVKRVVYATMKNTDMAILELNTTFKQLVNEGFKPLTIERASARVGEPVEVIGIPGDGVQPSLMFLHEAVCKTGQSVNIQEDVYHWVQSIRNHCSLVGGMSGSPMISLQTHRIVGIVNTGVDDKALAQPECSLDRPCEISKNGSIATFPNENYAQRVNNIPSCFDKNGIFNLYQQSCRLEKP